MPSLSGRPQVVDEKGIKTIVDFSLRVLDEVGLVIENRTMCERLADAGARWDGESGLSLPRNQGADRRRAAQSHR